MNGTGIEALHATDISASSWPPPSLPRGRLTTVPYPLRGALEHLTGVVKEPSFSLPLPGRALRKSHNCHCEGVEDDRSNLIPLIALGRDCFAEFTPSEAKGLNDMVRRLRKGLLATRGTKLDRIGCKR